MPDKKKTIIALSGGVGGAKLALGLAQTLDSPAFSASSQDLTVITNTADDFEHLSLPISPDLDTVMYTLAGINNTELGWGLAGETWQFMQSLTALGGENWFQLGDKDLATHIQRKALLKTYSLTTVTQKLCEQLDIKENILPMCDEPVQTQVCLAEDFAEKSAGEELGFQQYFVQYQCRPVIGSYSFTGINETRVSSEVQTAIDSAVALIVCPSNPFASIEPILSVVGMQQALENIACRVVVSPIVAGLAIKGPAAKMMQELGMPVTALAVAQLYKGFATHFVLDCQDQQYQQSIRELGMQVLVRNTIMKTDADKKTLATEILHFIAQSEII